MKSREFLFCLASSLAVLPVGLRGESPPHGNDAASDSPVVMKLVQRDHVVTVRSDGGTPIYTIETKTGETIVRDVRADDLKAFNPDLYQLVIEAIAGASGIIDASIWPR